MAKPQHVFMLLNGKAKIIADAKSGRSEIGDNTTAQRDKRR